ncbi:acyl-CoA carboxylase epsilon subunit [Streptomyces sp. PmtG]
MPASDEPLFRVVRGTPSAAELAALTAVLLTLTTADESPAPPPTPLAPWRRPAYPSPTSWQQAA